MNPKQEYADDVFVRFTNRMFELEQARANVIGEVVTDENMKVLMERMARVQMLDDQTNALWNIYADYCEAYNLPIRTVSE